MSVLCFSGYLAIAARTISDASLSSEVGLVADELASFVARVSTAEFEGLVSMCVSASSYAPLSLFVLVAVALLVSRNPSCVEPGYVYV